jgi:spermidine synthase
MVLEVAWTRFLALMLGSSVYAFTTMLVAFLLGTAGGALLAAGRASRRAARPLRTLGFALLAAALLATATHHLFRFMPFWFVDLWRIGKGEPDSVPLIMAVLAVAVMTPPTLCLGMLFPLAVQAVADRADALGRAVARLYVANTLGAVLGAALAGFVLIPRLGIQDALRVALLAETALAAAVLAVRAGPPAARALRLLAPAALAALLLLLRPPWDPLLMSAGMYQYVSDLPEWTHEAVRNHAQADFRLLYYAEGVTSTVTVATSPSSGNTWLANNGKVDASSIEDLRTQVLLGHLPFLFRPESRSALVIGLASGVTAGSVTLHEGLERVDLLEIEPAIATASHYFDDVNHRPLSDPRVRFVANDGRNHLELQEKPYDVIVSEPSNPWISGVSNLFTEDFLRLGRSKLRPDGAFVQWIQSYGMAPDDLRSLLRTFCTVFPHAVLLGALDDGDLFLVGSQARLQLWPGALSRQFDDPRLGADLARIGFRDPWDLVTFVVMERDDMLRLAGDVPVNTDDNARIEFHAPLALHRETKLDNAEMLMKASPGPWTYYEERLLDPQDRAAFLEHLAAAWERRDLPVQALEAYLQALGEEPGRADLLAKVEALGERLRREQEGAR